ncbi:flippase-like domain-containing protein [Pendulispora brunnea]|uniref:Flippase-like domain-containing protein n=1 Tax=Pendulispora brunnea TaxID=2905690 RepID=A0ABZ2KPB1_9BACT
MPLDSAGPIESRPGVPVRRILLVVLLGVAAYGAFAVYTGIGKIAGSLQTYAYSTFFAACLFAFANYVTRFLKWEFYLARLDIRGVAKLDSFLTFLSGFILTISPGKVGEVFKSLVLHETHGVPVARTAPIVIAERVTDLIGIIVLITLGSIGFSGGMLWASIGAVLVLALLIVVGSRRTSLGIIGVVERMPGKVGKMGPKLRDAYESLATLVAARNLVIPTLLSIVAWSFECLSLWVVLQGFGQSTSVLLCTFFYATSTLAGAIIPVPGGLGVTEGALQRQMMELGNVSEGTSTAAMLLVRFATLWFAVLVGFVALSALKRRHPGLFAKG